jgi:hypothetical protein
MPDWPGTLDVKPLIDAYDERAPNLLLRTPMDSGPAKVRRKLSNNSRFVTVELNLDDSQLTTFDDFFMTTILGGALSFNWVHPRTGTAIESRIVADENQGPEYRLREMSWLVTFLLEILP